MSEYQYYEFQAVDRRLTEKQIAELRSYSTRARITPTSFVNEYSWGDFKGDQDAWVEQYFDAFLYLANWGTHVFKLSLPARALDVGTARPYCGGAQAASVRQKNGRVIFTFVSEEEGGDGWVEADGLLSSLIPVRAELARGDLRALYLAWLLCAQDGDLDDETIEPPVPPVSGSSAPRSRVSSRFSVSILISSALQPRRAPRSSVSSLAQPTPARGSRSCRLPRRTIFSRESWRATMAQ